jgi:hypothetical protein
VFESSCLDNFQFLCWIFHDLSTSSTGAHSRDELVEAPFSCFIEGLFAITVSIENAVSFSLTLLARKSQDFAALMRRRRCRSSFSASASFFSAIAQHSDDVNIALSVVFGGIFPMKGN